MVTKDKPLIISRSVGQKILDGANYQKSIIVGKKSFKRWILSAIGLGLLPWLVNLFVVYLFSGNMSFYNIFKISDLNFFVIILCASTIIDISDNPHWFSSLVLGLFLVFSSMLLGFYLFNQNFPSTNTLYLPFLTKSTWFSLILSLLSLISTVIIQFTQYRRNQKGEA